MTLDDLQGFLERVRLTLPEALAQGVLEAAQYTAGVLRRQARETFPSGRTGQLMRSFKETFIGWKGAEVSAGALSDLEYADILDRGGTIRPRTRKNLAVPILAGKRLPVGKWPRHFGQGELTFIARKGRDPLLARVKKGGGIEPLFVLKESVTIRGRGYIEDARENAAQTVEDILGNNVESRVDRVPEE